MKLFYQSLLAACLLLVGTTLAYGEGATDSHYFRAGDLTFISAQIAINPATGKIEGDTQEQVLRVFENLQATAKEAGGSLQDIVKLTVYMADIDEAFPLVKQAIPQYFSKPYPARTPVGSVGFPTGSNILLAIDAVMYQPAERVWPFQPK